MTPETYDSVWSDHLLFYNPDRRWWQWWKPEFIPVDSGKVKAALAFGLVPHPITRVFLEEQKRKQDAEQTGD